MLLCNSFSLFSPSLPIAIRGVCSAPRILDGNAQGPVLVYLVLSRPRRARSSQCMHTPSITWHAALDRVCESARWGASSCPAPHPIRPATYRPRKSLR
jgi:hypothetical protein